MYKLNLSVNDLVKRKTEQTSKLVGLREKLYSRRSAGVLTFVAVFAAFGLYASLHLLFRAHALDIEWNVECNVSHFVIDDPIVFPGVPGASHMHSFYGNSGTNAFTTTASVQAHDPTGA